MPQSLCQTPEDVVILAAQLAFLKEELSEKRAKPSAFLETKGSITLVTDRGARFRDLRDRLGDACEATMMSHPAWSSLCQAGRLAVVMVAESVITAAAPIPYFLLVNFCTRAIESIQGRPGTTHSEVLGLVRTLQQSGLLHLEGLSSSLVAPTCIPLEALADAA